jgi:hypothetical protein
MVAAILVLWLGFLHGVPHQHTDTTVSQLLIACPVEHSDTRETHLHDLGESLTPRLCLACLAGSTIASIPVVDEACESVPGPSGLAVGSPDLRSGRNAYLPLLRGPPVVA